MRPHRRQQRKPRAQGHPVILFTIGETTFAIAASAVNEIQSLVGMKAIPHRQFGKVRHTLEREGRRYWVVDANIQFGMLPTHSSRVLLLNESPVAVKVDGIDRMTEIGRVLPLPKAFQGDEQNWYAGLAVIAGRVIPVVNPAGFLSHHELNALEESEIRKAPVQETAEVTA
ncbi:MAG TPA: chemotaxis protein CheW [Terriglobales bacterium]|nr:chemotaxis protein CheW [Terriglobales bacterium]